MRILVAGANGQVGQNLVRLGQNFGFQVFGTTRSEMDIIDSSSIEGAIEEIAPDLVINAAAYTAVDKAESEAELAHMINVEGPSLLAKATYDAGIPLFHISSDYVFDGLLERPYKEEDLVNPTCEYGKSKEAGEHAVREGNPNHIILRTSWVFSKEGGCFPRKMINLARTHSKLKVVNDQIGGPTSASAIASVLFELAGLSSIVYGTYHFSQLPYVSWWEFAKYTIERYEASIQVSGTTLVEPCSSTEYPAPVIRPKDSRLDCSKLTSLVSLDDLFWKPFINELIDSINEPVAKS